MTYYKNLIFCFTFLICSNFFAQTPTTINELEQKYTDYFKLDREAVFLHLNKTSVAPGEDLWLSAYIQNPKQALPNRETVNLNLDIYNADGTRVDSKTMLITGGKGSAHIALDKTTFPPGNYVLKAGTNYMKNFLEDLSYEQPFKVLGEDGETNIGETNYDLQLLPEGGHLLANAINTVGVKLIDGSGKGVPFTDARVVDETGKAVTTFKSNTFGISRFNFNPELNKTYTVKLKTGTGKEISLLVPKPEATGITLTSAERPADYIFSVKTNAATREALNGKSFYLAMHKNGAIKDLAFQFPEGKNEANIAVSKDSLFPGVNTITVINENLQPVLERLIFNRNGIKRARMEARMTKNEGDSLTIQLNSKPATANSSLSVSVLPSETKAYDPQHNIITAFYLKPHVKGNIDNAPYYFSAGNERRKMYDLDLLLLTQGWSKYSWNDVFNNTPKELFPRQIAFGIEGNVQGRNNNRENSLFIRSDETGLFEIVEIKEDNSFRVENLFIVDSTELSFGLLNERNSKVKKPSISSRIFPLPPNQNRKETFNFPQFKKSEKAEYIPEDFIGSSVSLDTVMLSGIKKNTEKFRNETRVFDEEVEITEELASRYYFITDYIASKGFRVRRTPLGVEIINNIPFSITEGVSPNPLIYFNGAPIGTNTELLENLESSQVESIVINKRGVGYGMNGGNGVIKITTKKGGSRGAKADTIHTVIAETGFTPDREFYAPKYSSYSNEIFSDYGVIDWIPNLLPDENGNAQIRILNVLQPNVKLFVEGMNAEGVLISEELVVKTQ